MHLAYHETPIEEIELDCNSVRLLVKREDQNHATVSGNKWWKLKYNLARAIEQKHQALLTFGGAYSNHIYATAAAGRELGLKTIGVIRGEQTLPLNSTLSFARKCGMTLHYISRGTYRHKTEEPFLETLREKFGEFYLIPEGGTNQPAVIGCREWGEELLKRVAFDYVCLPVGTAGTIAGLVDAMPESKTVIGFPVLKGAGFLEAEIKALLTTQKANWQLQYDYHFGGYAKQTDELASFIQSMNKRYKLPLDRIYTGKMFYGVLDLIQKGFFKKGSTILVLHTGGLQIHV